MPADWQGKRIRLKFDAVYHDALVTLNGKDLGSHSGGYTPFEFDVTDVVKVGAPNVVTVCADSTYQRGAWWSWGGISRSVTLIANEDARIVWQHIRTEPDLQSGTAKIFVRYKLANAGGTPLVVSLAAMIDGTQEPALAKELSVPARGTVEVDVETTLPKSRVRLWHFDHPCIIGWSVGNELTIAKHFDYVQDMLKFTSGLDPHRIVTHVSNTAGQPKASRENDPVTLSPLALHNTYGSNRKNLAVVHERWPDKAIFCSEFGMKQMGGNPDARSNGLEELYQQSTEGRPYVIGVSLWTFNDYRSGYVNTPPS